MIAQDFSDFVVLYPSVDDVEPGLWVAHSVRTDQVGVGHDPIEAFRELALAVRTLLEEAAKDPRVRVEQPAPMDVLERMTSAKVMPERLWQQIRAAIRSCQHHDRDYWSEVNGEFAWDDDESSAYLGRFDQLDLCPA